MDLIFIFNACCFEHEFSVVLTYNIGKPSSLLVFCILKNHVKQWTHFYFFYMYMYICLCLFKSERAFLAAKLDDILFV